MRRFPHRTLSYTPLGDKAIGQVVKFNSYLKWGGVAVGRCEVPRDAGKIVYEKVYLKSKHGTRQKDSWVSINMRCSAQGYHGTIPDVRPTGQKGAEPQHGWRKTVGGLGCPEAATGASLACDRSLPQLWTTRKCAAHIPHKALISAAPCFTARRKGKLSPGAASKGIDHSHYTCLHHAGHHILPCRREGWPHNYR